MTEFSPSPLQRRPTKDHAAAFIENRITVQGPSPVSYVAELDRFLAEPDAKEQEAKSTALWDEVQKEKDALFVIMEEAQKKLRKKHQDLDETDLHSCNWNQVMGEFQRAEQCYKDEAITGAYGAVVKCLRKLGENAGIFQKWIALLPDGDYGSVICGAFKIVLGAASRMQGVRQSIYDALREIPEAVQHARRYVQIYDDMEKPYALRQQTVELYREVLIALQHMMKFLVPKNMARKMVKGLKAIVQQEDYEDNLAESIKAIQRRSVKIKDEAVFCSQARQRRMDENTQEVLAAQQETAANTVALYENLFRTLLSTGILDRNTRQLKVEDAPRPRSRRKHKSSAPPEGVVFLYLRKTISYDSAIPAADLRRCRELGPQMDFNDKDRASFIANSPQIHTWLTNNSESQALLINAHTTATDFTSPMSYLCAEITHLYSSADPAIAISYFCGLHVDSWRNPRANAKGMMVSLIGQLLDAAEKKKNVKSEIEAKSFDAVALKELEEKIQKDSQCTRALCRMFGELLKQLPSGITLFCLIDTISIYETKERLDDTMRAIRALMKLVADESLKVVFKLLVTAPGRCQYVHTYFGKDEIFNVPEHIDGNRQGVLVLDGIAVSDVDTDGK